jgi:hypothetical protein
VCVCVCVGVCEVFRLWKRGHKYVSGPVYKSDLSCSLISSPQAPVHPVICGHRYEVEIRMSYSSAKCFLHLHQGVRNS